MSNPLGLLGLDRKAMEEERLARAEAKRKRTDDNQGSSQQPAVKIQKTETSETRKSSATSTSTSSTKNASANRSQGLQYPLGVVKRTWAQGYERRSDIKIEEVLQKNDLRCAVVSSWQWDFDWLVSKIDPGQTKFVFVMQAKTDQDRARLKDEFKGLERRIRLCFPPMNRSPYSKMHSKLMILFHNNYVRIALPSANPVPFDWGETGSMENSVFLIDLPRLPASEPSSPNRTLTNFARELEKFLLASEVYQDIIDSLMKYDFTATSQYAFIHSIPGSHAVEQGTETGLQGLAKAIDLLGLSTPVESPLEIDFVASSIGSFSKARMNDFKACIRGIDASQKFESTKGTNVEMAKGAFRIVFPSVKTVQESNGSFNNGGTIFMSPNAIDRDEFPNSLLTDYQSTRQGLLSHNKLIFARSPTSAFFYSGSANLSQAAWGTFRGLKLKTLKLTVSNWECGVLVPVVQHGTNLNISKEDSSGEGNSRAARSSSSRQGSNGQLDATGVQPMSVFDNVFEVPFQWPPRVYSATDKPWSASMQN